MLKGSFTTSSRCCELERVHEGDTSGEHIKIGTNNAFKKSTRKIIISSKAKVTTDRNVYGWIILT